MKWLAIIVLVFCGTSAFAVQPDEMLPDPVLEARARALSGEFRCLVCQNQSIDESDAPLAKDLRVLIREQLVQGKSNAEVNQFVVERYGDYVLLKPPFRGTTLMLWLLPFVILAASALYISHQRKRDQPLAEPLTAEEEHRLAAILQQQNRK